MLTRERIALRVLEEAAGSLPKTVFVKLMFLLRMETELAQLSSFYDFVPYKFGPHSFALYRDLYRLGSNGYVSEGRDYVALNDRLINESQNETEKLAKSLKLAVANTVERYGKMKVSPLILDVYERYQWFALNSEREERNRFPIPPRPKAPTAIYTIGYEGRSVDAFFNYLLEIGIETVIDVRANPVSRKYGFAGNRMKQIGDGLGIGYQHYPTLGVPSSERTTLSDRASRERLFAQYEQSILVNRKQEIRDAGKLMSRKPSVLVCVERDVSTCHRSRLSQAIAKETGMEVVHL